MQKKTPLPRNYIAFLWHAIFLSITLTFTEVNSVVPALILELGGGEIHVGIVTAIMIGVPLVAQLNFAGFLHGKRRKKPFLLAGINLRVLSLAMIAVTLLSAQRLNTLVVILLIYAELLIFTT
ncbi:MAG: MFS transporter, partial [Spirochaetota bacterium]